MFICLVWISRTRNDEFDVADVIVDLAVLFGFLGVALAALAAYNHSEDYCKDDEETVKPQVNLVRFEVWRKDVFACLGRERWLSRDAEFTYLRLMINGTPVVKKTLAYWAQVSTWSFETHFSRLNNECHILFLFSSTVC